MLKWLLIPTLLLAAVVAITGRLTAYGLHDGTVDQYFTPALTSHDLDCKTALIAELNKAQIRIAVEAWRFTDKDITAALRRARSRGVQVAVVLDASMETDPQTQGPNLLTSGIPTVVDDQYAYMHGTVFLIDSDEVITGSYNPTIAAAKSNAENLVLVHSTETAAAYAANFTAHANESRPFILGGFGAF